MTPDQKEAAVSMFKLGTAWAAVGVTSWADFAAVLAALYSLLLICEFLWKKVVKPFATWRGWIR